MRINADGTWLIIEAHEQRHQVTHYMSKTTTVIAIDVIESMHHTGNETAIKTMQATFLVNQTPEQISDAIDKARDERQRRKDENLVKNLDAMLGHATKTITETSRARTQDMAATMNAATTQPPQPAEEKKPTTDHEADHEVDDYLEKLYAVSLMPTSTAPTHRHSVFLQGFNAGVIAQEMRNSKHEYDDAPTPIHMGKHPTAFEQGFRQGVKATQARASFRAALSEYGKKNTRTNT